MIEFIIDSLACFTHRAPVSSAGMRKWEGIVPTHRASERGTPSPRSLTLGSFQPFAASFSPFHFPLRRCLFVFFSLLHSSAANPRSLLSPLLSSPLLSSPQGRVARFARWRRRGGGHRHCRNPRKERERERERQGRGRTTFLRSPSPSIRAASASTRLPPRPVSFICGPMSFQLEVAW